MGREEKIGEAGEREDNRKEGGWRGEGEERERSGGRVAERAGCHSSSVYIVGNLIGERGQTNLVI